MTSKYVLGTLYALGQKWCRINFKITFSQKLLVNVTNIYKETPEIDLKVILNPTFSGSRFDSTAADEALRLTVHMVKEVYMGNPVMRCQ